MNMDEPEGLSELVTKLAADLAVAYQAIAERDQAIAGRDQVINRLTLTSTIGSISSIEELLELAERCNLPDPDEDFERDYLLVGGDQNTSAAYVSQQSSIVDSQLRQGDLALSHVRLRMTAGTRSAITLRTLDLTIDLEPILCEVLFGRDNEKFQTFVNAKVSVLMTLQRAFYHVLVRSGGSGRVNELQELQPVALLFLESIVKYFHPESEGRPAQRERLEGTLTVNGPNNTTSVKNVGGYTDLLFGSSCTPGVENLFFHMEVKPPRSSLYQSGAFKAKDQLIFETAMIAQMTGDTQSVMGGLFDMFTLAILLRVPAQGMDGPIFYISHRVTDPKAVILRVLLLLCKDKEAVWSLLLPGSTEIADLVDDEAGAAADAADDDADDAAEGGDECDGKVSGDVIGGGCENSFAVGSAAYLKAVSAQREVWRDMDRKEEYEHSLRRLFAWDNTRKGLSNLTAAELNKRRHTACGESKPSGVELSDL